MTKKATEIQRWNVLIAEDDLKNKADLVLALSKLARCTTVSNGEEAFKAYQKSLKKKTPFDFILLDVAMPGLDGFGVLKAIRQHEETNTAVAKEAARIIMITTYKDSLMENYNMGWDEYITKPVDDRILIDKMKTMAGSK